jgi:hypothetical protein
VTVAFPVFWAKLNSCRDQSFSTLNGGISGCASYGRWNLLVYPYRQSLKTPSLRLYTIGARQQNEHEQLVHPLVVLVTLASRLWSSCSTVLRYHSGD